MAGGRGAWAAWVPRVPLAFVLFLVNLPQLNAFLAVPALSLSMPPGLAAHRTDTNLGALGAGCSRMLGGEVRSGGVALRSVASENSGAEGGTEGAATKGYMDKIPHHLRGLAIRNAPKKDVDYVVENDLSKEDQEELKAALKEFENDNFDWAMEFLEIDELDGEAIKGFQGDVDDAAVLKELRSKMTADDFQAIFGRGIGDLL